MENVGIFMAVWNIRLTFGISYGHLVHVVVIWSYGHIFPVLVCCTKKNLSALVLNAHKQEKAHVLEAAVARRKSDGK
jgi:hypothetical protein